MNNLEELRSIEILLNIVEHFKNGGVTDELIEEEIQRANDILK